MRRRVVRTFVVVVGVALETLCLAPATEAHTWIDCLDTDRRVVYDNAEKWLYGGAGGNGLCKGYIKNYVGRGDPEANVKETIMAEIEQEKKGKAVCKPGAYEYNNWRKKFQVRAGEKFYYAYKDNGHVAKDQAGRGTMYGVYWTGKPDTELTMTTEMTEDKLIDGKLHNFDDGNCGETDDFYKKPSGRSGDKFPCVGEVVIPPGTAPGTYNFVWYWRFYDVKTNTRVRGIENKEFGGAAYSSCFQVEVLPGGAGGGTEGAMSANAGGGGQGAAAVATPSTPNGPPGATTPSPGTSPTSKKCIRRVRGGA